MPAMAERTRRSGRGRKPAVCLVSKGKHVFEIMSGIGVEGNQCFRGSYSFELRKLDGDGICTLEVVPDPVLLPLDRSVRQPNKLPSLPEYLRVAEKRSEYADVPHSIRLRP